MRCTGFRCKKLAKDDLGKVCEITGFEQLNMTLGTVPIAQEEVLDRIVERVCILTGTGSWARLWSAAWTTLVAMICRALSSLEQLMWG